MMMGAVTTRSPYIPPMTNAHADRPRMENEERRTAPRRHVLRGARIVFNHESSSINCIVRDLTANGAKLEVPSVIGIPDEFELRFDRGRPIRLCSVQWKLPEAIGVRFL